MPDTTPLDDREFGQFQSWLHRAAGINLSPAKKALVAGRLFKRLKHYELKSYGEYFKLIMSDQRKGELQVALDLLTTNETYFFREHPHFDFFGEWLAEQRGPIKIWSAACSSGEEPYSLAMVASESARTQDWSIVASDLSQSMLARARDGIYDMAQAKYFPQGWLKRHCLNGVGDMSGRFRVQAALRERVSLREINITQPLPEPLGPFNVIFLRNVLIYFNNEEKQRIVRRLITQLTVGGLLFIGHAESIHGFDLPMRLVCPSVYELL